ncbi:MAG: hypothetical protein MMC23_004999 [Stictis urceolatum]|nr:hypothetical protein [Stictis urceolata]
MANFYGFTAFALFLSFAFPSMLSAYVFGPIVNSYFFGGYKLTPAIMTLGLFAWILVPAIVVDTSIRTGVQLAEYLTSKDRLDRLFESSSALTRSPEGVLIIVLVTTVANIWIAGSATVICFVTSPRDSALSYSMETVLMSWTLLIVHIAQELLVYGFGLACRLVARKVVQIKEHLMSIDKPDRLTGSLGPLTEWIRDILAFIIFTLITHVWLAGSAVATYCAIHLLESHLQILTLSYPKAILSSLVVLTVSIIHRSIVLSFSLAHRLLARAHDKSTLIVRDPGFFVTVLNLSLKSIEYLAPVYTHLLAPAGNQVKKPAQILLRFVRFVCPATSLAWSKLVHSLKLSFSLDHWWERLHKGQDALLQRERDLLRMIDDVKEHSATLKLQDQSRIDSFSKWANEKKEMKSSFRKQELDNYDLKEQVRALKREVTSLQASLKEKDKLIVKTTKDSESPSTPRDLSPEARYAAYAEGSKQGHKRALAFHYPGGYEKVMTEMNDAKTARKEAKTAQNKAERNLRHQQGCHEKQDREQQGKIRSLKKEVNDLTAAKDRAEQELKQGQDQARQDVQAVKDKAKSDLKEKTEEKVQDNQTLREILSDRNRRLDGLEKQLKERDRTIKAKNLDINQRDGLIKGLKYHRDQASSSAKGIAEEKAELEFALNQSDRQRRELVTRVHQTEAALRRHDNAQQVVVLPESVNPAAVTPATATVTTVTPAAVTPATVTPATAITERAELLVQSCQSTDEELLDLDTKYQQKKTQLVETQKQLRLAEERLQTLNAEIARVSQEQRQAEENVATMEANFKALQAELPQADRILAEMREKREWYEAEYRTWVLANDQRKEELEAEYRTWVLANDQRKEELEAEYRARVSESDRRQEDLEARYRALVSENDQREKDVALLDEQERRQKERFQRRQEQLSEKRSALEQLTAEINEAEEKLTELQSKNAEVNEQINEQTITTATPGPSTLSTAAPSSLPTTIPGLFYTRDTSAPVPRPILTPVPRSTLTPLAPPDPTAVVAPASALTTTIPFPRPILTPVTRSNLTSSAPSSPAVAAPSSNPATDSAVPTLTPSAQSTQEDRDRARQAALAAMIAAREDGGPLSSLDSVVQPAESSFEHPVRDQGLDDEDALVAQFLNASIDASEQAEQEESAEATVAHGGQDVQMEAGPSEVPPPPPPQPPPPPAREEPMEDARVDTHGRRYNAPALEHSCEDRFAAFQTVKEVEDEAKEWVHTAEAVFEDWSNGRWDQDELLDVYDFWHQSLLAIKDEKIDLNNDSRAATMPCGAPRLSERFKKELSDELVKNAREYLAWTEEKCADVGLLSQRDTAAKQFALLATRTICTRVEYRACDDKSLVKYKKNVSFGKPHPTQSPIDEDNFETEEKPAMFREELPIARSFFKRWSQRTVESGQRAQEEFNHLRFLLAAFNTYQQEVHASEGRIDFANDLTAEFDGELDGPTPEHRQMLEDYRKETAEGSFVEFAKEIQDYLSEEPYTTIQGLQNHRFAGWRDIKTIVDDIRDWVE